MTASEIVLEWIRILERRNMTDKARRELQNIYDRYQAELTRILTDVDAGYSFSDRYNRSPLLQKAVMAALIKTRSRQLEKLRSDYRGMTAINLSLAQLLSARDPAATEKILRGILLEYPNDATTSYYLGNFYYLQKKFFKARTELKNAVRLNRKAPWIEQAKKILADIEQRI